MIEDEVLARTARWKIVLAQVSGAWLCGSAIGTLMISAVYALIFGAVILVPVTLACAVGGFVIVASSTKEASPLTRTAAGRFGWSLFVCVGGAAGLAFGANANAELELPLAENHTVLLLVAGVPFALAAAILASKWTAVPAILVVAVLVLGGSALVKNKRVDEDNAARLKHVGTPLDLIYVTKIPGYKESSRDSSLTVTDLMPVQLPGLPYLESHSIALYVERATFDPESCAVRWNPGADTLTSPRCTSERPGLWHRYGQMGTTPFDARQEYVQQRGEFLIRANARPEVAPALIRQAVLSAHHPTTSQLHKILPPLP